MPNKLYWLIARLTICFACIVLTSCAGPRVVDVAAPAERIVVKRPLATASDGVLTAELNWITVRNGPGSWVTDANWDEYILSIRNDSSSTIRIRNVTINDSLDNEFSTSARRTTLRKQSKVTLKRYEDLGLEVKPGFSGDALMFAGTVAQTAGATATMEILKGSLAIGAIPVAIGAVVVLSPALIIGGTMRNIRHNEISEMIVERHSNLPILLKSEEEQVQHFFFPIAPSPQQVEITYVSDAKARKLVIDTKSALRGLHLLQPK